jgi:hypothetical protein
VILPHSREVRSAYPLYDGIQNLPADVQRPDKVSRIAVNTVIK